MPFSQSNSKCLPTSNTTCSDSGTTLTQPLNGILLQQQLYHSYTFLRQTQSTATATQLSLSTSVASSYRNSCAAHLPTPDTKHSDSDITFTQHLNGILLKQPLYSLYAFLHPIQYAVTVTQLSFSHSMAFSNSNSCTVCTVYMLSYDKYNVQ